MQFTNLNTQYNQISTDIIASIKKENTNSAKSNVSSVYESADLNLDAAVLSISTKGSAKMNAMLSKSIQLRACSVDPSLTAEDRRKVSNELRELRKEMEQIRTGDAPVKVDDEKTAEFKKTASKEEKEAPVTETEEETIDVEQMMAESRENILKHAEESIQLQVLNRERILQLL